MRNTNESTRNNNDINKKEMGPNCNIFAVHTAVSVRITVYLAAIPCFFFIGM